MEKWEKKKIISSLIVTFMLVTPLITSLQVSAEVESHKETVTEEAQKTTETKEGAETEIEQESILESEENSDSEVENREDDVIETEIEQEFTQESGEVGDSEIENEEGEEAEIANEQPPTQKSEESSKSTERNIRADSGPISSFFRDPNLARMVAYALNRNYDTTATVTTERLATITSLSGIAQNITSLLGIENLTGLNYLHLENNQIVDISPLASLTNLQSLYLSNNQIKSISSLENLTSLRLLYLYRNQISDISALENLINLDELNLYGNKISNINPLRNLTKLTRLSLYENQVNDISALENLRSLTQLLLYSNQISDISPLRNITSLTMLALHDNKISNVDSLSGLVNLTMLTLGANQISDISSLSGVTAYLDAQNQTITLPDTDVSPTSFKLANRDGSTPAITNVTGIANYDSVNNLLTWNEPGENQFTWSAEIISGQGQMFTGTLNQKVLGHTITESYYGYNNYAVTGSLDYPLDASLIQQTDVIKGDIFTGTPADELTDSGEIYKYVGWKKSSDPDSMSPRTGTPTLSDIQSDQEIKYLYQVQITPELTLVPDRTTVKSGDMITWTLTYTNASERGYLVDASWERMFPEGIEFVSGSLVSLPDNTPISDTFWNDTLTAAASYTGTVTFQTKVTGNPEQSFEIGIRLSGGNTTGAMATGNVNIGKADTTYPTDQDALFGLKMVPEKFIYENATISVTEQTVLLDSEQYAYSTVNNGLIVQVYDNKETITDWRLTATLSPFTEVGNSSNVLSNNMKISMDIGFETVVNPNTSDEVIIPSGGSSIVLPADNTAVPVMSAGVSEKGTWNARIDFDSVNLFVPANTGKINTEYEAKITWTLISAP